MPRRRRTTVEYEDSDPSDNDAEEQVDYEDLSSGPFGNISVHRSFISVETKKQHVAEADVDEDPVGIVDMHGGDGPPELTIEPESDDEEDAPIERPKEQTPRKSYQSV